MNCSIVFPFMVVCGLLVTSLSALAFPTANEEEAIAVLLDSHAGSNEKLAAVSILRSAQRDDFDSIVFALARQCHYDMKPVRDLAREALIHFVGERQAEQLIASYFPQTGDFLDDFGEVTKDQKRTKGITELLAGRRAESFQLGVKSLALFALADPKYFQSLNQPLKARLVAHLDCIDLYDASLRSFVIVLVEQLDPVREAALPLIFRALDDQNPDVQKFVQRLGIADGKNPSHRPIVATIINGVASRDRRIASASAALLSKVPEDSIKRERDQIVWAIAAAADRDNLDQVALLKQCKIPTTAFIEAVSNRYSFEPGLGHPESLLKALYMAGAVAELEDSSKLRELFVRLLGGDDDRAGVAAAELYATPKLRAFAVDKIIVSIKEGKPVLGSVLKEFKPDPEWFNQQMIEPLGSIKPSVVRAAIKALLVTGIQGDGVRAALAPLLRHPDSEIRNGAAQLLNTPEALARARVPEILSDIRSTTLSTRQRAARQLDELGIEPKEITAALIRAVESGNFAAREGLTAALESANSSGKNPLDLLNQTAKAEDANARPRAYARAALREIKQ